MAKFDPTWIDDAMELVEGSPVRPRGTKGEPCPNLRHSTRWMRFPAVLPLSASGSPSRSPWQY